MQKPWLSTLFGIVGSVAMYLIIHTLLRLPFPLTTGIIISALIPTVIGAPIFYLISYLYRQLKQRYRELNELNAQKDVLLSLIAHDIRSPLANLQQSLSYAAYDKSYINNAVDTFPYLDQRVRNTLELLDSLLNWSRSQLREETRTLLSPHQLLEELLQALQAQLAEKRISVDNRIDPALQLPLHEQVLSLVLRNLLVNAIKFTPAGGHIELGNQLGHQQLRLWVADTGVGMDADTLARLFSQQPTTSKPGTDGETGSGIGLLLCKQLLHSIGGEIQVSSAPGEGSRFEIQLPCA